jgi:hypothetical protein
MKMPYNFIALRYLHDVVTGEFANVGVVVYSQEARFLEARFTASYERLNALFVKIDHAHYRNLIRYLSNRFAELSVDIQGRLALSPISSIEELARQVLPPDDGSLQWSPVGGGFSDDLPATLVELFGRLVERYTRSNAVQSRSDEDIAKPFRAKLEKKKVSDNGREFCGRPDQHPYELFPPGGL